MKTENRLLMKQARESLKGNWGLAILVMVIYALFIVVANSFFHLGPLLSILITGPFTFGLTRFSLALSRNNNPELKQLFDGFNYFKVSFLTHLLIIVFIFLWSLLLIIPGIIAGLAYSMSFFIISDDPSMSAREAIRKSKQMMIGNKWKFFCLNLRFIGWTILSILSLGVGFIWLAPYIQISKTKFYEDLKRLSQTQTA